MSSSANGAVSSSAARVAPRLQERQRRAHVGGPGRPARRHAQLALEHRPAVDAERRAGLRRRVEAQRAAGRERLRGGGDRLRALGADHRDVDRLVAVRGRAPRLGRREPLAIGLAHPHGLDAARVRGRDVQHPAAAGADDEQAVAGPDARAVLRPQRAAERLGERRRDGVEAVERQQLADQLGLDPHVLGEPARVQRRRAEPLAQRLVAVQAAPALAARRVVVDRDAVAGGEAASPRRRPRTTSPTGSCPSTAGSLRRTYQPTSEPQVAHASTRQTTSPGPHSGSGRSSIRVSPGATVSATLTPPSPPCRPSPAARRRAR